ncbi:hypothetical protein Vafri_15318, partial [Volvox africanus]
GCLGCCLKYHREAAVVVVQARVGCWGCCLKCHREAVVVIVQARVGCWNCCLDTHQNLVVADMHLEYWGCDLRPVQEVMGGELDQVGLGWLPHADLEEWALLLAAGQEDMEVEQERVNCHYCLCPCLA